MPALARLPEPLASRVWVAAAGNLFRSFRGPVAVVANHGNLLAFDKAVGRAWRLRLAPFLASLCPRNAFLCFTLPEAVHFEPLADPLWVFCGMLRPLAKETADYSDGFREGEG